MSDENDDTSNEENDETEENSTVNENVTADSSAESTENEEAAPVDHMAEMAAAMAAEPAADIVENEVRSAESIAKSVSSEDVNIETLLKVPVSLAIEVGRTQMSLNDLLDTQEGSVIELERLLDEPLDILVNGALIAHGVVVLANERFGLQITDIISLEERARSL